MVGAVRACFLVAVDCTLAVVSSSSSSSGSSSLAFINAVHLLLAFTLALLVFLLVLLVLALGFQVLH